MANDTASATLIKTLLRFTQKLGVDVAPLLAQAGQTNILEMEDSHRLPAHIYQSLWAKCVEASNDPLFGLKMGASFESMARNHLLLYVILQCNTTQQALQKLVRYHDLMNNHSPLQLVQKQGQTGICFDFGFDNNISRHVPETFAAAILFMIRHFSQNQIQPVQVQFSHSPAAPIAEYADLLGISPDFNQAHNLVLFSDEDLEKSLHSNDPALLATLENYASKHLDLINKDGLIGTKVKLKIAEKLNGEVPRLDEIAKELAMGKRKLQQQLQLEETSFRELLDEVRRELGLHWLQGENMELAEIAFMLGFQEQSSFNHAFKRWTGSTPLAFKNT